MKGSKKNPSLPFGREYKSHDQKYIYRIVFKKPRVFKEVDRKMQKKKNEKKYTDGCWCKRLIKNQHYQTSTIM